MMRNGSGKVLLYMIFIIGSVLICRYGLFTDRSFNSHWISIWTGFDLL